VKKLFLKRSYLLFAHDLALSALCFVLSWHIRLFDQIDSISWTTISRTTLEFCFIASIFFLISDIKSRSWRYATEKDYLKLFQVALSINLLFFVGKFLIDRLENIPRSLFIINTILLSLLLLVSRIIYKFLIHFKVGNKDIFAVTRIPVLIAGLDDRVELFLRENSRTNFYEIVGILDDASSRKGTSIYGAKILGPASNFTKIYNQLQKRSTLPRRIIISDKYSNKDYLDKLTELSDKYGIKLARLPKLTELDYSLTESKILKPIIIEDLLLRDQSLVQIESIHNLISGKTILVTGAGGTIGYELSKQIASSNAQKLILLENSEYNLYQVYEYIKKNYSNIELVFCIADVRNKQLCSHIFKTHKPDLVFHAAALKHVPIVEMNFTEGIDINTFGTKNIADLCVEYSVKSMVLISTDKAINPSSIMGTTKRLAEMYLNSLGNNTKNKKTYFTAVRFGNVLGSSGSVIPLFNKQISEGGPITITDPGMKRYFMTVREAVSLVLQASSYGVQSQDHSNLYILDMGEQIYIKDLAKNMIKMAGLEPDQDIKIEYTGIRPGEKLSEALFSKNEKYSMTESGKVFIVEQSKVSFIKLSDELTKLKLMIKTNPENKDQITKILKKIVKNYENQAI